MKSESLIWFVAGVVLLCLCIGVVSASTRTIIADSRASVFIGEEGLDISPVVGSYNYIAFWPAGSTPGTQSPTVIIYVFGIKTDFLVSAAEFAGYDGNYYVWDGSNPPNPQKVFTVVDPALGITIWNPKDSVDEGGKSVARGTYLTFRIATNMYHVAEPWRTNAPGDVDEVITIKVRDPSSAVYTQLYDSGLTAQPLTGQFPTSYPFYYWGGNTVPAIWATGAAPGGVYAYAPGTYTVWAESTLNNMKDNYLSGGAVYTGKTVSNSYTVTLVGNPGKVSVSSNPPGATIWIDDFLTGAVTPATIDVSPGSHYVRVSRPNYYDQLQLVSAIGGGTVSAPFTLSLAPMLNAPPTVSGILPVTGDNTGAVATSITGTQFAPSGVTTILTPVNANPVHKGSITDGTGGALLAGPQYLFVSGNYAYVTSFGSNALEIVDITDPANPKHEGSLTDGGGSAPYLYRPASVFVSGDYAYVVGESNALEIIDVTIRANPVHIGSITHTTGGANLLGPVGVFVKGDYAYVTSAGGHALEIVNINNKAAPVHVSKLSEGFGGVQFSQPWAIYIAGNYAYITSNTLNTLEIVDISDPLHPYHEGSIKNGDGGALLDTPVGVFVSGNYAYVTSPYDNALEIIDVSNPAAPLHKSSITNSGGALLDSPRGVYVSGNYAYVTSYYPRAGLEIVDVTDPANPVHKSSIIDGAGGALLLSPMSVFVSGNYAYVTADSDYALEIVDIGTVTGTESSHTASQIEGSFDLTGKAPGQYNVVVTNPGGSGFGTFASGFTVTSSTTPTGSITVTSDPTGADVFVDGTFQGTTPGTYTGIAAGTRTVKITLTDYFDVVRPVDVTSGGTSSVSVTMDKISNVLTPIAKEAVQATMTDVLHGDTSGKVVYVFNTDTAITNPTIEQWPDLGDVTFANPGVISYVDLLPEANHAKEGLFVNTYTDPLDGKIKTETKTSYSPATKINDAPVVFTHGAGIQPSPGELGIPNDPKVWAPGCTVNCNNYYALLISGGTDREHNEVRYWNDISYMYNVLIENGYNPGNIKVLVSDGANIYKDRHIKTTGVEANDYDNSPLDLTYPADGYNDVNDAATAQKVNDYLAAYATGGSTPLTSTKSLFIFTTSHGSKISGTSRDNAVVNLNLWNNEALSDAAFVTNLTKIQAGSITVVMEQCNGGGFYDNWIKGYSGTQKRTLITAADWNEPSWGNGFSDAWTSGVAGHLRGAESTCCVGWDRAADTAANERVSLQESYKYVMPDTGTLRDPYATRTAGLVTGYEHPQIFSAGTSNDPTAQYLNDCTGTVASKIDTVTPATPSVWKQGSHQIISWKATALAGRMVKVTLFKGTSLYPVVSCSPGVDAEKTTSVGWYVPSGTGTGVPPTGTSYKIKVETCSGTAVSGTSVGTIQINPPAATPDGTITINTVPSTGIKLFWEGTQVATSTPYTRTDKDGKYSVRVTKDSANDNPKYYPYDALVTITAGQTNTLATWNLLAKPTGANGEDLDPAPEGGIIVNANQDPALVWTCKYDTCDPRWSTCAHPTNCEHSPNVETPNIEKRLVAGFSYDVYVTKDGFLPSEKQTVYIEQPYPYRVLVPLFFTLTQKPEVPAKVLIVPNPLNIGKTGYFLAIVRLPDGYKAADVDAGSVYCEGAKALKLVRIKLFPRIFVGIFSRQDLGGSTGTFNMYVWGLVKKNSEYVPFRGSDTITIINKKVTTKEDIDNVMTMPDAQVFTKFNKF